MDGWGVNNTGGGVGRGALAGGGVQHHSGLVGGRWGLLQGFLVVGQGGRGRRGTARGHGADGLRVRH